MFLRLIIIILFALPFNSFSEINTDSILNYDQQLNDKISNNLKKDLDNSLSLRGANSVETFEVAARFNAYTGLIVSHIYLEVGVFSQLKSFTPKQKQDLNKIAIQNTVLLKNLCGSLLIDNERIISLLDKYISLLRNKNSSLDRKLELFKLFENEIQSKIREEWGNNLTSYYNLGSDTSKFLIIHAWELENKKRLPKDINKMYPYSMFNFSKNDLVYSPISVFRSANSINNLLNLDRHISNKEKTILNDSLDIITNYIYYDK